MMMMMTMLMTKAPIVEKHRCRLMHDIIVCCKFRQSYDTSRCCDMYSIMYQIMMYVIHCCHVCYFDLYQFSPT